MSFNAAHRSPTIGETHMNARIQNRTRPTLTADAQRQIIAYATEGLERLEADGVSVTQAVVAELVGELLPIYLCPVPRA